MTFCILDATHPLDRALWEACLAKLPAAQRDLHFDPSYVAAYAAETEDQPLCALYNVDEYFMLQPFIPRGGYVEHAYGYGGVVYNDPRSAEFAGHFRRWMNQNSLGERTRYHPFVGFSGNCSEEKKIVYMDLSIDPEEELRKGHKSSLELSRRSAVTVETSDDLGLFRNIYLSTMRRHDAHERWQFSDKLLPALREAYPDGFQFLIARVGNEPEAGCILLGAHQTCYYHYAGSYGNHRRIGVGQAIVIEAAKWAKAQGFTRLHLGGGTTPDPKDPLYRFKSGFSKRRAWVYKYEREFN